jgi:hypothetical protein
MKVVPWRLFLGSSRRKAALGWALIFRIQAKSGQDKLIFNLNKLKTPQL